MSAFTTVMVEKPPWFRISPLMTGWGKREPYVIGWDSEAYRGRPMLWQFSLPGTSMPETSLVWTSAKHCLDDFLTFLEPIAREADKSHKRAGKMVIVVGWNLQYEYTQLFRNIDPKAWQEGTIVLHDHQQGECSGEANDDWDISIEAMNLKRYAFTIKWRNQTGKNRHDAYTVRVIDGMAFFNTGLDKAAKVVGIEGKLDLPEEQKGTISPRKAMKDDLFIRYSKQDAYITRLLGEKIIEYHKAYDVRMTISAPMYAAYVFRRKYLNGEIQLCDDDLEEAGLASYHGGKNGFYLDRPSYFEHAWDYDVNAAYTSAMAQLPDPVTSEWEEVDEWEPAEHALWYVRGWIRSCTYRAFQHRSGRWLTFRQDGEARFWITSYELTEAISRGEIDLLGATGFVLRGESGTGSIRRFCDDMYDLKLNGKTPEERQMAKLCLNSLYGKLIQKTPMSLVPFYDIEWDGPDKIIKDHNLVAGGYKAGGLYHPALASLVTGSVRARIHAYEHKYQSLMTSTDGFLSAIAPDPADIGDQFGGLKVKEGNLSVWRERLYHFQSTAGDAYALHGFRGRLADLRAIPLEPGRYEYRAKHMVGLRDSLHKHDGRRYEPGQFATTRYELDLMTVNQRSPIRVA